MTDGFEVDLERLGRLIRTLEDGADQVRQANAELGGFSSVEGLEAGIVAQITDDRANAERLETLGNESLAGAALAFGNKWRYGLGKLDEAAQDVVGRLRETKESYGAVEEAYTELFNAFAHNTAADGGSAPRAGGIQDVLAGDS
jgi:hypothetical protein